LDDFGRFVCLDLLAVNCATEYPSEVKVRLHIARVALDLVAVAQRTDDHPGNLIACS
jgi:hypothetical protein